MVPCVQEFIVAASQRLTDLRDVLSCPADVNLKALGLAVPSAYFYIEGTFYRDMRAPGSLDYSEQIIRFCVENKLLPPAPPAECHAEARQQGEAETEGGFEQTLLHESVSRLPSCIMYIYDIPIAEVEHLIAKLNVEMKGVV